MSPTLSSPRSASPFRLVAVLVVCSSAACARVEAPPEVPVAASPSTPTTPPAAPTATEASPDLPAMVGGVVSGAAPPPAGGENGRPIGLLNGHSWDCPFPAEADSAKIDRALVTLRITVAPDGTPSDVAIITDPGHGFGRAARTCALAVRYRPALDRGGVAISASTVIKIRFVR